MSDGKLTIPFSTNAVRKLAESVLDAIVVVAVVLLIDRFFGFNLVPEWLKVVIGWPVLIGAGWLTWKAVRNTRFFR